jgi:hypothetical protein
MAVNMVRAHWSGRRWLAIDRAKATTKKLALVTKLLNISSAQTDRSGWGRPVFGPLSHTGVLGRPTMTLAVLDLNLGNGIPLDVADIVLGRGKALVLSTGYGATGLGSKYGNCVVLQKPYTGEALGRAVELSFPQVSLARPQEALVRPKLAGRLHSGVRAGILLDSRVLQRAALDGASCASQLFINLARQSLRWA